VVTFDPRLPAVEPERTTIQRTITTIEPAVEPVGPWSVVAFDATIAPLDLAVSSFDACFPALEPPFNAVVASSWPRGGR
jgi:hypothetical protein